MSSDINSKYCILVVDDEPLIRESLYEVLRIDGYQAYMAATGEEAVELIKSQKIDIVVTDMKLPQMSGLEVLDFIKKDYADIGVILITGYGTIETAVGAMKRGAYDYISKPINDNEIKIIINKIVEKKQLEEENRNLREIIAKSHPTSLCSMIGGSEEIQKVYHIIDSVASSNATILILGDSGTGKGLVARAIHQTDKNRNNEPFVEVSCGALSETLLESELFGHVRGAFTGAIRDKEGRFEFAKGGTIFLDEIDSFSLGLQVKLLRVLQDGVFERVGDNITRKTGARILVATNQDLVNLVKEGEFREDLYYRVNVISINVPPLRERKDDIEILADHFIGVYGRKNKKKITGISDEVRKLFLEYNWPGNIRELENAIEGAVIMAKTEIINKRDLPNASKFEMPLVQQSGDDGRPLKKVLEGPEREMIVSSLEECGWNRNRAAAVLGINRTTLFNKMKKYNIDFKKPK